MGNHGVVLVVLVTFDYTHQHITGNVDMPRFVRSIYYGHCDLSVVGDTNMKLTRCPPVTPSTGDHIKSNVHFSQETTGTASAK